MKKQRVERHAVTQPLETSYRYIALTKGQTAIVDASDFEWLSKYNWNARLHHSGKHFYARTNLWIDGKIKTGSMHRMILGCKKGEQGDHINFNTLDNRRENLRKCTQSQNTHHRKVFKNSGSRFKGVEKIRNRWRARIVIQGKKTHLGMFDTKEGAAKFYDSIARQQFGEFAHLNFPIEPAQ